MRSKSLKRLVIDTDVVRASGDIDAIHPRAINCRDFLKEVLTRNYRVVLTKEIKDEWKRNRSNFARKWQVSMYARKNVVNINSIHDEDLQYKIIKSTDNEDEIIALKKDLHLLHAALATDKTIISCEQFVRTLFAHASRQVDEIRGIVWVNPDRTEEEPIIWLKNGAPPEVHRQLSEYQPTK